MRPLPAVDICRAVGGTFLQTGGGTVTGVTSDSRQIASGDLFIPLVGARFDGHDYIDTALSAGAAGCLCSRVPEALLPGTFYIQVQDTTLALGALAAWYRSLYDIPVVQVTGSAGKTTTKEMIASVLSRHFRTLKTQANLNNHIGTPQTLLRLEPCHQAAVIETGMDHFGQIRYMGSLVQPTIAVITNVGDAHIENLGGTRQGTLRAKCEIFDHLRPGGLAVLCGDDELLNGLDLPFETLRCGRSEHCNVRVTDIVRRGIDGLDCTVTTPRRSYRLSIPSPGDYMIYSASMAVAIGEYRRGRGRVCVHRLPYAAHPPAGGPAHHRRLLQRQSPGHGSGAGDSGGHRLPPPGGGAGRHGGTGPHQSGRPPAGGPRHRPAGAGRGDRHRPQGRCHRPDCRSPGTAFRRH